MQRPIQSITIQYQSATGEEMYFERSVTSRYTRIRTRLCGGAGGFFTVYLDRADGNLVTHRFPQARIIHVTTILGGK